MPIRHVAVAGESIESIAYRYGMFWETVWDAPQNAALREARKEPNILVPGDVVLVPDKRAKDVAAETGKRHVFRRRGVPSVLRVQLREAGKARAGMAFTVKGNTGWTRKGTTDADGWVECYLMPDVQRGELRIDSTGETFVFQVGTVGPADTAEGVQTRLRNLGYYHGSIGSSLSADAVSALAAFQREHDFMDTGQPDEATRDALVLAHGS